MKDRQLRHVPPFHIASARGTSGHFVAWAKMGPIQAFDPIAEPGEHVWFQIAPCREKAEGQLLQELGVKL